MKRKMLKWVSTLVFVACAVAALVLVFRPRPVLVDAGRVQKGPLQVTVDEDGKTRVRDRYVISTPVSGTLQRLTLHPGDSVGTGSVLARIAPILPAPLDVRTRQEAEARLRASIAARSQTNATVERSGDALRFARGEAERQRVLASRGVVGQQALDQAELQARTAAAELRSAEFALRVADYEAQAARAALGRATSAPRTGDEIEVRSPVSGRVLRVMIEAEGVVAAGAPILEVGDPTALEVVVDVLTTDAVGIESGAHATLEGWGGDNPLRAAVRRVEPAAFTRVSALGVEEQRVNVLLDLLDPPARWSRLGDGFRVEARIVVWEKPSVVHVPSSALWRQGAGWAVFVVQGGRAQTRRVVVGHTATVESEILRGLREGERVILHPADSVKDGTAVAPR